MSRKEALLASVGEIKDMISLHAVDTGVAKIKEKKTMSFIDVMGLE